MEGDECKCHTGRAAEYKTVNPIQCGGCFPQNKKSRKQKNADENDRLFPASERFQVMLLIRGKFRHLHSSPSIFG